MNKRPHIILGLLLAMSAAGAQAAQAAPRVTLTYATWNLGTPEENTMERQVLGAWNAQHPDIQVAPAAGIRSGGTWMASLAAAAAAGTFPDIVMLTTLPDYLARNWLADITSMAASDPEWAMLPGLVRTSTTFNYRIYSIPFAQQAWGFFVNKDLLAASGVKIPDAAWTIADFTNIVRTTTQPRKPAVGLAEELDIPNWYPVAANSRYGWFTWDGAGYHLDGPELKAGVDLARSFYRNGQVWASLPEAARKGIGAASPAEAFSRGSVALMWDATWAFADAAKWSFAWDFLPAPGVNGKVIGIPDYLGIGRSSRNPVEAYAFARYMSAWSSVGFLKRIDIARAGTGKVSLESLPLTTSPDVLHAYYTLMDIPALSKLLGNMDSEVLEPLKWVPGYERSRWDAAVTSDNKIGDILVDTIRGDVRLADVATQLNSVANQQYRDALAEVSSQQP